MLKKLGFKSDDTHHNDDNHLDSVVDDHAATKKKPTKVFENPIPDAQVNIEDDDEKHHRKITKSAAAAAQSITNHNTNKFDEYEDPGSESEDVEPVEVLLQFIPYYGQGDPSNDSIVRSTLSSLSVEDIDSKDEYGNTLLLLACQYRCEDLVRIMLNKGADPNAVNSSGACCLHFACYRESASIGVAKILLKSGANPDVAEATYGCTPLHYCAGTGDIAFCKLLLSYGAQINALDSYNYTCVDYAREAGMSEVAQFLDSKLKALVKTQSFSNDTYGNNNSANTVVDDISNWESHIDPDTGGKYYIHFKTGECLWEAELKQRFQNMKFSTSSNKNQSTTSISNNHTTTITNHKSKAEEEAMLKQSFQARLVVFFTTHDPSRLVDVDALTNEYNGKESELLTQLGSKYNVDLGPEIKDFQNKVKDLRIPHIGNETIISDINLIDPLILSDLAQEERKKYELRLYEETNQLKKQYETQLKDEKSSYIQIISEKDGLTAKLQSQIDALEKSKASKEEDVKAMHAKISTLQLSGGETLTKLESELEIALSQCAELRAMIAIMQEELQKEKEKSQSLEAMMSKVSAGNEEIIAREQAAADERAKQTQEREEQHKLEIHNIEERSKNIELKLKTELTHKKNEFLQKESELQNQIERIKNEKDLEIDAVQRELAQLKSQYAQEISAANMQINNIQSTVAGASKRAEEAEKFMEAVKAELAEAKVVQKYNLQLHKDLQREQQARKKLHNDMEDLKGKIRVYVRIRPFSKSEQQKGCEEAVFKDGKMTVLLKGLGGDPNAKKYYDFDQVFGGSMEEGNSQADIFKDTKHLIQSVVDGYNVCIFAYGQTGAGKSFTMIGAADIGNCLSEEGEFDDLAGITPRAVSEVFRLLHERSAQIDFTVEVQMFQLYRDGLEDLLKDPSNNKKQDDKQLKPPSLKITLAEHSPTGLVYVEGAACLQATTPGEVMKIFAKGSSRRTTASTQMNAESSRSHLICSLTLKLTSKRTGKESVGKLTLVDLAGSERNDKSGAVGEALKEAQSINKSLSALGDVIAALTTNSQHVPYRNHPLTMLMSDSIGGNAKTLMFVNTSPADYNSNESNSSLSFASRCKDVTNQTAAGSGVQAAQLANLKKELAKLKKGGPGAGPMGMGGGTKLARPDTAIKLS